MKLVGPIYRPPSEASSLLLQATIGCSHNRCAFCAMYRDKQFRVRPLAEVLADIRWAGARYRELVRRVFICDGNALILPMSYWRALLAELTSTFPHLQRVGAYANARDILTKTEPELAELRQLRLSILYLGMESGCDRILKLVNKGARAADMVASVTKAQSVGIKCSVIYLLGLGGRKLWRENATESAWAVSLMNPAYLSALTLTVIPGTPLAAEAVAGTHGGKSRNATCGWFQMPSPEELALELRLFLEEVQTQATVFRSNHASNYVPLAGRLPRDRERLLAELDEAIREHRFRPESLRGL